LEDPGENFDVDSGAFESFTEHEAANDRTAHVVLHAWQDNALESLPLECQSKSSCSHQNSWFTGQSRDKFCYSQGLQLRLISTVKIHYQHHQNEGHQGNDTEDFTAAMNAATQGMNSEDEEDKEIEVMPSSSSHVMPLQLQVSSDSRGLQQIEVSTVSHTI
jgi:hypothetical protein